MDAVKYKFWLCSFGTKSLVVYEEIAYDKTLVFLTFVVSKKYLSGKKIMKRAILFLLFLLVILALVPLFLPKTMTVETSRVMGAPIEDVYLQFADLRNMTTWDAWAQEDPNILLEFSEPSYGTGAWYTWESDRRNLGQGKMTITESKEFEYIFYNLQFEGSEDNSVEVLLQKIDENNTKVTWSFFGGEMGYPYQVFNVFMKGSIEKSFAGGLNNLSERLMELGSKRDQQSTLSVGETRILQTQPFQMHGTEVSSTTADEDLMAKMNEAATATKIYLIDQGVEPQHLTETIVYWLLYDEVADKALYAVGYKTDTDIAQNSGVKKYEIPAQQVVSTMHGGPASGLNLSYDRVARYMHAREIESINNSWDVYKMGMDSASSPRNRVQVFFPINTEE